MIIPDAEGLHPSSPEVTPTPSRLVPRGWEGIKLADVITVFFLLGILAGGYWLRSVGRNWDDYTHLHPDERFLSDIASRVGNSPLRFSPQQAAEQARCDRRYPPPSSEELAGLSLSEQEYRLSRTGRGGYFDAQCSDLNPNNIGFGLYVYGQFPLFTTRITAETIVQIEYAQCIYRAGGDAAAVDACNAARRLPSETSYNGVHLVGRMVSSAADTLTILLVFLIGFKLFGRWPGLIGAGLYAFAAFPIQQSHFWTVDAFTTLWVTLAIYAAVNVLDNDALHPARFSPVLWLAAALGVWAWELERLEAPTVLPLLIYGAAFGVSGVLASLAAATKNFVLLAAGLGSGVTILAAALGTDAISAAGLVGALVLVMILAVFIYLGLNRQAAYGGSLLWLMGAFALWVYDGLAHYANPSLTPLVLYLAILGVGAILASVLVRAKDRLERLRGIMLLGVPLVLWTAVCALAGALSWEGAFAALVMVGIFSAGTALGYRDYLAFGVAFGAALAGRINSAPLVGVLILAVIIRSLPVLDRHLGRFERYRLLSQALAGLLAAAALAVVFFRILQPHAFLGAYELPLVGNLGIIPIGINDGWAEDVAEAQRLVSGAADIPPNYQWANRTPWLFPLQNIVLYGMGPLLGLTAWAGVIWGLGRIVSGGRGWTRLALPVAWVTVYFGWLGKNWVTTMRYFLPIYGTLALLAGWLLVELLARAWRGQQQPTAAQSRRAFALRRTGLALCGLLLAGVIGYTALYGYGMTAIYRTLLTRTGVSLWFQENVPSSVGAWIERADSSYRLQNLTVTSAAAPPIVTRLEDGQSVSVPLELTRTAQVLSVVLHRVTDPERDSGQETIRVRIQRADSELFPQVIAERTLQADVNDGLTDFGDEYSIRFDDDPQQPTDLPLLPPDSVTPAKYEVVITIIEGGPVLFSRGVSDNILPFAFDHLTVYLLDELGDQQTVGLKLDDTEQKTPPYTFLMPSQRGQVIFAARTTGVIRQIEIPHLADPLADSDAETLRVELSGTDGSLAYGQVTGNFEAEDDGVHSFGQPVTLTLDPPLRVEEGQSYSLTMVTDAPLTLLGHVIATEGPWDDPIPYKVCPLPNNTALTRDTPSGYTTPTCIGVEPYLGSYYGLELYLAAEDDDLKRQTMIDVLDKTDFLTISSNRFYDSLSRIPFRWPLTMDYYRALWDGSLGFELVLKWTSYPRAFGFEWKDQVLPTDDLPQWLNEFEVEEAFTVYDHPTVYVFRKTEAYDPQRTRQILSTSTRQYKEAFGGFSLDELPVNRNVVTAPQASVAPTGLMLTEEAQEIQRRTSWSDLFDRDALINRSPLVTVVMWWAAVVLVGWLIFPLLFAILPALPDRGFAAAKFAGWLLVAWLAWFGTSIHLGTWSRGGIALCLLLVALVSAAFGLRRWRELSAFLRHKRRHLLLMEGLTLLLFLAFLYVRYRNPDLWHNSFGGEKPMDFAYFNGVLRSQSFPPLDPWFSGGYINYYYWGFVLVAAPTKLLGVVPATAYNLIIPTLFAMTGMGAFSVAYNLIAARVQVKPPIPMANPYVAGVAALLLMAVLGNLDTPRVFVTEVAKMGGWVTPSGYNWTQERRADLLADFQRDNGREPTPDELAQLDDQAQNAPPTEDLRRLWRQWRDMLAGFSEGIDKLLAGEPMTMPPHRWYWAPTRIIAELPEGRGHNAINEMPYFTFLYGDLHAHMMAMPMMLLAVLWLTGEILGAGRGLRTSAEAGMSLLLGGVSVGLLRATNTWDWPTFTILAAAGLTYAAWVTQRQRMVDENLARTPFFERLMRFLDLRGALGLWWLVWAMPLGFLAYSVVWLFRLRSYNTNLSYGKIPQQCQLLSQQGNYTADQIPDSCKGLLEPIWQLSGGLTWAVGAFLLALLLVVAALILFSVRFDRRALLDWLGRLAAFGGLSFLAAAPFAAWYAGEAGLEPWTKDRTPLWAYLDIHGLFIFILFSFLCWQTVRLLKRYTVADLYGLGLPMLLVVMGVPLTLLAALLIGLFAVPIMLVTLPMMAWAAGLFFVPQTSHAERIVYALMVLALGLTTGVEIVVLDVDIGRQNMVFKFYMQAWLLFSLSSAVAAAWLLHHALMWKPALRGLWQTVLAFLVTAASLYPLMATQARWMDRFDATRTGSTLDGHAYMQYAVYGDNQIWYNLRGDYDLINWLNEHIEGTPTIIEAQTSEYKWGGRIAINTGLPTVIGWNWHQRQQRNVLNLNQVVWTRSNNVAAFYTTPSIEVAWELIRYYKIDYIILGVQERVTYNDLIQNPATRQLESGLSPGLRKFDDMVDLGLLRVVYEAPTCVFDQPLDAAECSPDKVVMNKVYQVNHDAEMTNGGNDQ